MERALQFFVPSGKQLVIEYVSGYCSSALDAIEGFRVTTTVAGEQLDHFVPVAHPVTYPANATIGQQTRIYADGDTQVSVSTLGTTAVTTCHIAISGNVAPLPL